jgi:hypothetical protein
MQLYRYYIPWWQLLILYLPSNGCSADQTIIFVLLTGKLTITFFYISNKG